MSSPKRILITSVFGYQNRGDWQLTDALVSQLRDVFPGCRLDALCRDPKTQAVWFPDVHFHPTPGVSARAPGPMRRLLSAVDFASSVPGAAMSLLTGLHATGLSRLYRDADLVIAAPGGYMNDANISILMHASQIWLAVVARKPVLLAPQSIGPLRRGLWRVAVRRLLRRVEIACARDEPSVALIRELTGAESRARLVPDMAFQDDTTDAAAAEAELRRLKLWSRPFVAMTVSHGGVSNYAGPPAIDGMLECLSHFCGMLESDGLQVLVWVHVESDAGTVGDEPAMRQFEAAAPPNVTVSYERYPPSVVRGLLRHATAVVAQRMHPCIFAAQVGTPFVAMANLPKFAGVLAMLELGESVFDAFAPDATALHAHVHRVMARREQFANAAVRARDLGVKSRALVETSLRELAERA